MGYRPLLHLLGPTFVMPALFLAGFCFPGAVAHLLSKNMFVVSGFLWVFIFSSLNSLTWKFPEAPNKQTKRIPYLTLNILQRSLGCQDFSDHGEVGCVTGPGSGCLGSSEPVNSHSLPTCERPDILRRIKYIWIGSLLPSTSKLRTTVASSYGL